MGRKLLITLQQYFKKRGGDYGRSKQEKGNYRN